MPTHPTAQPVLQAGVHYELSSAETHMVRRRGNGAILLCTLSLEMFDLTANNGPIPAELARIEELEAAIEAFEDEHSPMLTGSRAGVIRLLAEIHGIDAERLLVLDDEVLAERFGVPVGVFAVAI